MTFNIGLFGLGHVGAGLVRILANHPEYPLRVRRICVKNPDKSREVPPGLLTFQAADILEDPEIQVVVEATSGSDQEAYRLVAEALRRGKHVVTANKKMLAARLGELLEIRRKSGAALLYEAAACGGIPIVRTLDEHFGAEPIDSISGIFNGTSNYVLTRMEREGIDFHSAVRLAQQLGFAELDPSSDIDGLDAKFKMVLLALHSHGILLDPERILTLGIRHLKVADIRYAQHHRAKIKLVPVCRQAPSGQLYAYVMPAMVPLESYLYHVDDEFNGIDIQARYSGRQFFRGRGAGSLPTGSAIMADLQALLKGFQYRYQKHRAYDAYAWNDAVELPVYFRAPRTAPHDKLPVRDGRIIDATTDTYAVQGVSRLNELAAASHWLAQHNIFTMSV